MTTTLTYKNSGVDVELAEQLVGVLKKKVPGIGGYSGLYPLGPKGPILAATTDGVGTKLKLAFMLDRHDTIGIDLVAMCANDLIVPGAKPLFFLDYYAMGRLDLAKSKAILEGILEGCRQAGMALLGGETAEMPGMYRDEEYDLAGFAVGIVDKKDLPDPKRIKAGDVILGLPSSGLHSNGFSLVRKAMEEEDLRRNGDLLLTPTRIYVKDAAKLRAALRRSGRRVLGMAHITGGGLFRNLGRVIPPGLDAELEPGWERPVVFDMLEAVGIPKPELFRTFNMGIGLAFIIRPSDVAAAQRALPELMEIGKMKPGSGKVVGI